MSLHRLHPIAAHFPIVLLSLGWLAACALLGYTAHLGGELVFNHGVGVAFEQSPEH